MKNIKLNIKENRLSYGTITPSNSGYKVLFFNPITKKNTYVGSRSTKEEAEKLFNETNYNFFSENSWTLPKGISFSRATKEFMFAVMIKSKSIIVAHSESLDEVVSAKMIFLNNIIS